MTQPSITLFGSQNDVPDHRYLSNTRTTLLANSEYSPFIQAIKELPQIWETVTQSYEALQNVPGLHFLSQLREWIENGRSISFPEHSPNVLLAPITVITQVADWLSYFRSDSSTGCQSYPNHTLESHSFQGLCVGMLTAIAFGTTRDIPGLMSQAGVAIRLAVLIGAVVDLDGEYAVSPKRWTSIIARFRGSGRTQIEEVISRHPDAYISVVSDEVTFTLTLLASELPAITEDLRNRNALVKPLGLQGRFHAPAHSDAAAQLHRLCGAHDMLRFRLDANATSGIRSAIDGTIIKEQALHHQAIVEILLWPAQWNVVLHETLHNSGRERTVLSVGLVNPITDFIAKTYGAEVHRTRTSLRYEDPQLPKDSVAVVGMGCKYPGADSVGELWKVLEASRTMASNIPIDRFPIPHLTGDPAGRSVKFWGNFVKDVDSFDSKFFNKSPREAAAMDPQQRLLLEVAYQALESTGWHDLSGVNFAERDVGCFIGCGSSDYNDNAATHSPSAFSILGALRGLLSGRISHHFGWEGPSITYDTACASSMVAIDAACKSLRLRECATAVAGGVNVLTSPNYYRYLFAAGFLSPSGSSRAFDAGADGYCRGEGAGLVVLKRFDDALAHGDNILGVIAATSLNQNGNDCPINVPSVGSQVQLFRRALKRSQLQPEDISYIEAHGTGTQVGDAVEAESVRSVFGSPHHRGTVYLGSLKDNIGHTEGSAGVAGLIKVLLMIRHKVIVPQAGFRDLNPKISDLDQYHIKIPMNAKTWDRRFRAACVNNYGAGGCNGALIVCELPARYGQPRRCERKSTMDRYPIFLSARTPESLNKYIRVFEKWLEEKLSQANEQELLPHLAFNLSRKQNSGFDNKLAVNATSLGHLYTQLKGSHFQSPGVDRVVPQTPRLVVLVFGGQTGFCNGLPAQVVNSCNSFRSNLEDCDKALTDLGFEGILKDISVPDDEQSLVRAHSRLFSIQYSTAKSWIDSGLTVSALVGHSFGQLTALCVAGAMSLKDALRLTIGRAVLIEELWGSDTGAMIAVEAASDVLEKVLDSVRSGLDTNQSIEIACYNSSNSFTLTGTLHSIERFEAAAQSSAGTTSPIKFKRLAVPYAFHSRLTDTILPALAKLADSVEYLSPSIPIETCSKDVSWPTSINARLLVEHTRSPVYFDQAIKRLSNRLGSCTWLEAGTGTPIISMVRRILSHDSRHQHMFHSVDFGKADRDLATVTASLWSQNHACSFWPFQGTQANEYQDLDIPPYQFDRRKHWLHYNVPEQSRKPPVSDEEKAGFCSFKKYIDANRAVFEINPRNKRFELLVQGHAVCDVPLCPASAYFDIAVQAAQILAKKKSESSALSFVPSLRNVDFQSPLGLDNSQSITMTLTRLEDKPLSWVFSLESNKGGRVTMQHATGVVSLHGEKDQHRLSTFSSLQRLLHGNHLQRILENDDSQLMRGALIYQLFGKAVAYKPYYQGIKRIASSKDEVVATVVLPSHGYTNLHASICDPLATDNFLQVAGINANCFQDLPVGEVFVATKIGQILLQAGLPSFTHGDTWQVYSRLTMVDDHTSINDIFVFNKSWDGLLLVILGVQFSRVRMRAFSSLLSNVSTPMQQLNNTRSLPKVQGGSKITTEEYHEDSLPDSSNDEDKENDVRRLIGELMDVSPESLLPETTFDDLGIDSLMVTEVANSIQTAFNVTISTAELQSLGNIQRLSLHLSRKRATPNRLLVTPSSPQSSDLEVDYNSTPSSRPASTAPSSTGSVSVLEANVSDWSPIETFQQAKDKFDVFAIEAKYIGYWECVHSYHMRLITAYIQQAFAKLGSSLSTIPTGVPIPSPPIQRRHAKLLSRLFEILEDVGVVEKKESRYIRTSLLIETTSPGVLHDEIVKEFPTYSLEHSLLRTTASRFADCLTGDVEAVDLLFGTKANRELLQNVYAHAPVFKTATKLLCNFLVSSLKAFKSSDTLRILEVGAGTGGTTAYVVEALKNAGLEYAYTFTDISSSLVMQASKRFSGRKNMSFRVLDVEKAIPPELCGHYDIVISTNCIHATRNLVRSCSNLRSMLKPNGFVALVELTRKMAWFDLVFGLLEGWWAFEDGRTYALADENLWYSTLKESGFAHVDWSCGTSEESRDIRVICGFNQSPASLEAITRSTGIGSSTAAYVATSVLIQGNSASSTPEHTIFAFPGGFGTAATYTPLPVLGSNIVVWALNSPFLSEAPTDTVLLEDWVSLYLKEIRRRQPVGPYTLMGYSVGGVMAYEAARQLVAMGESVRHLILLDSACPVVIPPFPINLLDFFDSIDRFTGRTGSTDDQGRNLAPSGTSANHAKKMRDPHVMATLRCLHQYRPRAMPMGFSPRTTLVAAREGVDRARQVPRPTVGDIERKVIEWVLDDRVDFSARGFGWNELIAEEKIKVVPVDGNHFSLMTEPFVRAIADSIR